MRSLSRLLLAAVPTAVLAVSAAVPMAHAAVPAQDRDFLIAAHQGNLAEIESAQPSLLGRPGVCAAIRDMGPMLITDHTRLDAAGGQVAMRDGVMLPTMPTAAQARQLRATAAMNGAQFNRSWLAMERAWHEQTLNAVRHEIAVGQSRDVQDAARTALPVVQRHLSMIQQAQQHC
jgi:putative membrane protein